MGLQTLLQQEEPAPLPGAEYGDWFIVRTRARQEKILARQLMAMSVPAFLPLIQKVRFYAGIKAMVELPLFPGYVFLRGSKDDAYAADRTRRVAQVITVTNQLRLETELRSLYLALQGRVPLDPYPGLRQGVWVEIRSGPLRGIRGIIEDKSRANLLILQVQILGRGVSLEVDGSLLDVIDDPQTTGWLSEEYPTRSRQR
jgi:transcription antitermination factor NusG